MLNYVIGLRVYLDIYSDSTIADLYADLHKLRKEFILFNSINCRGFSCIGPVGHRSLYFIFQGKIDYRAKHSQVAVSGLVK